MLQDMMLELRDIPRAVILAALLGVAYLFVKENRGQVKTKLLWLLRQRWLTLFIFYLAFVLTNTLFARQHTTPYVRIFENFGFGKDPKWDKEIIENILLFVPYTFLFLQAVGKGRGWKNAGKGWVAWRKVRINAPWKAALVLVAGTSVTIEICQLVFWLGSFQLADLVHNVMGGMIGCGLWYVVEVLTNRKKQHK